MRSQLTTAALGAAVVFLLATHPVVVDAAGQITGAQIKNNTVKSKDVRDKTLKGVDVRDGSLGLPDLSAAARAQLLDHVAFAFKDDSVALPAGSVVTEVVAPVGLTVPAGVDKVHIISTSSMIGNGNAALWVQTDSVCVADAAGFGNRVIVNAGIDETPVTFNMVTEVTPGAHTFRVCARSVGAGTARHSTISVETVSTGG